MRHRRASPCRDANPESRPRNGRPPVSKWHKVGAQIRLRSSFGPRRKGAPEFESWCAWILSCPQSGIVFVVGLVPKVGIAPTSPPLQGGANLSQLLEVHAHGHHLERLPCEMFCE